MLALDSTFRLGFFNFQDLTLGTCRHCSCVVVDQGPGLQPACRDRPASLALREAASRDSPALCTPAAPPFLRTSTVLHGRGPSVDNACGVDVHCLLDAA